jgi:hypothetical protein
MSLSKTRSPKELLTIHMKFLLVVIIGLLLWNNNDARKFTSNMLQQASDLIEPQPQTIGEKIDSFLN